MSDSYGAPQADGLSPSVEPASAVSPLRASIPSADGSNWTRKTVAVWEVYYCGEYVAYKVNFYGDWHLKDRRGVVFSAHSLQEVMEYASAIEARQGGDGEAGSVHESAAPKADAQPQDPTP